MQRDLEPDWFQRSAHGRLRVLPRPLQRRPRGRAGQARLDRAAGHQLRPLHALPEAAPRRQRRRLFGDGLPGDQPGLRHDGGVRGGGEGAAPARHQPLRRPGAEPHRQGARLGGAGPGRRGEVPRLLPDVRRRHPAETVRGNPGRGLSRQRAGQLHLLPRARQMGLDHLQRAPVGPELGEPVGVPRDRRDHAVPRQQGRRRGAAGRGGLHVEADGHALPVRARGAHDPARAARGQPDRGAVADPPGGGDRGAGRDDPLSRPRRARRPRGQPRLPQLADGAVLVGAGHARDPADDPRAAEPFPAGR